MSWSPLRYCVDMSSQSILIRLDKADFTSIEVKSYQEDLRNSIQSLFPEASVDITRDHDYGVYVNGLSEVEGKRLDTLLEEFFFQGSALEGLTNSYGKS